MTPDQLLAHFDRISDATDAIPRLRKFILELAVRGKLVEQAPHDEPASEMLERVRSARRDESAKNRLSEIVPDELPYVIPRQWEWVRLGQTLNMINGRAFKPTDWLNKGLPIVRIQNLNNELAPFNYCDEATTEPRHIIESGCFLISWSGTPGTSFGAFIWQRGKAALNQHIFKCLQIGNAYYDRFLQMAINGRLDEMIAKAHGGVGLQHITKGKLENLPLSLPPLSEQRRIVAKVDELMALCDQFEATQAERERRRDRLAAASLARLNQPADAGRGEEFRNHVRFHLDHLPRLTTRPEQIPAIRQTILDLAIRGLLIQQNPNAKFVLGVATVESVESLPYPVPLSWQWERMGELVDIVGGSQPPKSTFIHEPREGYTRLVQIRDFKTDAYATFIPNSKVNRPFNRDDIMIGRYGPPLFQILRGLEGSYNVALMKAQPNPLKMTKDYLFYLLQESRIRDLVIKESERTAGQTGVRLPLLRSIWVAIPPLAEQRDIVRKIEELMAICDELESRLTTAQTQRSRLLEAILHEALEPATADALA